MTVSWLSGCAVDLPSSPASNPADANAPAAVATPFRPTLLATSRTFLSLAADDRERAAQQMDLGKTKSSAAPAAAETYFTCPMHPEIKEAKPGNCPICGMTLINKSAAAKGAKP